MYAVYPFILLVTLMMMAGCQRPLVVDDDQTSTEAVWEKVDFNSERLIQGLHATPFEWHAISENQFFRFNGDDEPIELRPLQVKEGTLGIPAMSDNTFVRMTTNLEAQQVLEFHLTKNPTEIIEILVDSLKGPTDDFIEVEFFARSLGTFSSDGTLFLLPATVLPDRHYVLLLFEVLHNVPHTEFVSVDVFRRIELEDLNADFANLVNMRFVDGNFYVASKSGAWRITPSGEKEKIFNQHMLDFFSKEGKLYATGINSFDLHESTDDGVTWERLNQNSDLIFVEATEATTFTQVALGNPYKVIDEDFLRARSIVLPSDAPIDPSVFYDVDFFAGRHYFSMDRSVYFTEEIILQ